MKNVACIGSGLVGSAWAVAFARGGCEVALFDNGGESARERSFATIDAALSVLSKAGQLGESEAAIRGRIRFFDRLADALAGADHVQESVREDLEVKRALFAELDRLAPADAVLASSTSAISGSLFMDVPGRERALVAHPVNPPSLIPLVELCGTTWTSQQTVARTRAFMSELGMKPVVLKKEIDGFLLNRLQYTLVAEAMHLVGEGYCSAADIDRVMTDGLALRWATVGPFEVAHLNATDGFQDFVAKLGGMMRHMGKSARTDYEWPPGLVEEIHRDLAVRVPLDTLPERQAWRDSNILATRHMQDEAEQRAAKGHNRDI